MIPRPADRSRHRWPATGARGRILAWYIAIVAIALVASIVGIRQVLLLLLDDRIESDLVQEAEELRQLAQELDPVRGVPFADDAERLFDSFIDRHVPGTHEAFLTFVDGELFRRSAAATEYHLERDAATMARWAAITHTTRDRVVTPAGTVEYLAVPVVDAQGRSGVYVGAIFRDLERADVERIVALAAAVGILTLLVASLLAWRAAGRILAPVRMMTETARRTFEGDMSGRIAVRGSDEIAELGRTFNDMLDRLDTAFRTQRAFVDDAGHELRTPITIIRGHLELMGDDPDELAETTAIVFDELDRMNRMVEDLLLLARAERPDFLSVEPVDPTALLEELHAKARALAPRRWRLDATVRTAIVADRQRLTQAIVQLAQNAVQHTGPADEIGIGARVREGELHLWVRDTGTGIRAQDHERIFERFARPAGGRGGSQGAGLGLAIVRAIAEAHGGDVTLASAPGDGATFTLVLPLHPAQPPEETA